MWVLGEVFALPRNQGKRSTLARWLRDWLRRFSWLGFDPLNTVLGEIYYWRNTISLIPERIKRRKMFL